MTVTTVVGEIGSNVDMLEAFYREHIEAVQRFIARRVAVPQDAADLTGEVFLAAIDSCQRYRPESGAPIAWLYGIARNLVAMHYRSAGRAARAVTRLDTSGWIAPDAADRIAARIDAESEGRQLIEAMAGLPERQRAVLELVAVDGLSLVVAAAALDITPTNARVRYHRARRALGSVLDDVDTGDEWIGAIVSSDLVEASTSPNSTPNPRVSSDAAGPVGFQTVASDVRISGESISEEKTT